MHEEFKIDGIQWSYADGLQCPFVRNGDIFEPNLMEQKKNLKNLHENFFTIKDMSESHCFMGSMQWLHEHEEVGRLSTKYLLLNSLGT